MKKLVVVFVLGSLYGQAGFSAPANAKKVAPKEAAVPTADVSYSVADIVPLKVDASLTCQEIKEKDHTVKSIIYKSGNTAMLVFQIDERILISDLASGDVYVSSEKDWPSLFKKSHAKVSTDPKLASQWIKTLKELLDASRKYKEKTSDEKQILECAEQGLAFVQEALSPKGEPHASKTAKATQAEPSNLKSLKHD